LESSLPESVTVRELGDKTYYLLGTAHVSKKSVEDVRTAVDAIDPDSICVELCEPRHQAMMDKERWKKMDVFQVIKNGKASLLLSQLIITSFYQQIGEKLGVEPGAEMQEGVKLASEKEKNLVLADRKVEVTLKRVWRHLSFWNKLKMLSQVFMGIFEKEEIDDAMIEEIKNANELESIMEMFAKSFPQIKERLIDERDIYLSQKIKHAPGKKVLAILGAGHIKGVAIELEKETPLAPLETVPPPSKVGSLLKWAIPLLIIAIPLIGFFRGATEQSIDSLNIWLVSHSLLAGLGSLIALAHPLTIIAAAVVAPFTSLNPMIAAGWVAGLVQAWVKKPTVEDLQKIPQEIKTVTGFWRNPTTRILLVVMLANLGSSLATFISGTWIITHSF